MSDQVSDPDVLVLLGTDHHPYQRLVTWTEAFLREPGREGLTVLLQRGFTEAPPDARASYADFLPSADLAATLGVVRAVVCHGGPGTIADCREAGLLPVVAPRSTQQGEHVDDHQQLYTARLASDGLIDRVTTQEEFRTALGAALARPRRSLVGQDRSDVDDAARRLGDHAAAAVRRRGLRARFRRRRRVR